MTSAGTAEVRYAGTTYRTSYSVKNGKVHILTPLGTKPPKPLGNSSPEEVTRGMLKELLHDRDSRWTPVRRTTG
jgi:hypothetical protein